MSDEHSFSIKDSGKTIQEARMFMQKFCTAKIDKDSKCYSCEYKSMCNRCPERFFLETGSYNETPCWMCETAKLIYEKIKEKGE